MNLKSNIYCLVIAATIALNCFSGQSSVIRIKHKRDRIINDYFNLFEHYSKQMCSEGADHTYFKYLREFRGKGFYIPIFDQKELDINTIEKNLPLIETKIIWINGLYNALKSKKDFSRPMELVKKIRGQLIKVLDIKEEISRQKSKRLKDLITLKSEKEYLTLRRLFNQLLKGIPWLLSYKFPVDHFGLRKEYDKNKWSKDRDKKKKSNSVYFIRRIVQDGALDPDKRRSDRNLRSNIDTLYLKMNYRQAVISEDIRYDLVSVLNGIEWQLKRGKKVILSRLDEWKGRTKETLSFYQSLLEKRGTESVETVVSKRMLEKKSKGRFKVKDFTLNKQREVYKFWMNQSELFKALFVIETILFNEVGSFDKNSKLERNDVTQIVINRKLIPFFNRLDGDGDLYAYLKQHIDDELIQKEGWLNVLFKTGEFSFTYYFIGGSVRIYCPDMSRRGKHLRRENLKIAIGKLRNPEYSFKAIRYFSRAGMLGRIDMSYLWDDYIPLAERPGHPAKRARILKKLYRAGKYQYFYSFVGPMGRNFDVVEIKNKTYSLQKIAKSVKFFEYRNPHYFKYFRPMENARL